jgi:uncharacterized repeat protein (TIGR03803 family)
LGADGNLYGTAQNGGAGGFGVLFKVTPAGTYAVIHSFQGTDGSFPDAGLVLGADGNLYGTTSYGGPDASCPCGTIFKASPSGVLTTLHSFDYTDGDGPSADMVQGADGDFFGTTVSGGTSTACDGRGCGTIFKISSQGSFTSLHSFVFSDGGEPFAPLVQASDGALYGVTFEGGDVGFQGCSGGCGTIFKIAPGGLFAIAHKFDPAEGGRVFAGLVQATNGSLYGSDAYEGSAGDIFEFTLPRTLAVVYSFTVASGGGGAAGVLQATDGNLYGTYGAAPGAVFRLEEGLGQFVAFVIPTSKVGGTAQILGQGLAGTTGVTFNGVEATSFNIVSDTYMTAVVPSGATNGPVVVTTPTGPLTSNVNFRVIK